MHRRTACRLLAGLLLAGLGCGRSSSSNQEAVELPPNRFPGARNKRVDSKATTQAKKN
jgi:hypothetical protein